MNRNEEYMQMLGQLDTVKAPENTVRRSVRRYKVNKYLVRPLAGIAVVFAAFTVLVNVSMKVAFAASRVPVLRDLASAVTFSRSLRDAVSNGYTQLVDIKQSDENVSVSVEYLIVDQKTVTVFYRAKSDKYKELLVSPLFSTADGKSFSSASIGSNNAVSGTDGSRLYYASLELLGEVNMPSVLIMKLNFYAPETDVTQMPKSVSQLEFELNFDPEFTSRGKHIELGRSVRLGEQTVVLKSADIYPSYMTVTTESATENSAWLRSLDLYVLSDRGERFNVPEGGVRAYNTDAGHEISNYRLDSPYFYNAKTLKLFISSAGWLEKGKERIEVDLINRTAKGLPEGVTLADVSRTDVAGKDAWLVTLMVPEARRKDYSGGTAEPCGDGYYTTFWQMWRSDHNGVDAPAGYCYIDCMIEDCPYDTVSLPVNISYIWQAETPLEITLDLRTSD